MSKTRFSALKEFRSFLDYHVNSKGRPIYVETVNSDGSKSYEIHPDVKRKYDETISDITAEGVPKGYVDPTPEEASKIRTTVYSLLSSVSMSTPVEDYLEEALYSDTTTKSRETEDIADYKGRSGEWNKKKVSDLERTLKDKKEKAHKDFLLKLYFGTQQELEFGRDGEPPLTDMEIAKRWEMMKYDLNSLMAVTSLFNDYAEREPGYIAFLEDDRRRKRERYIEARPILKASITVAKAI